MKVGDLIKHKTAGSTAVILDIFVHGLSELEYRHEEHAKVLFSGDNSPSSAPLQLLEENWEVINEI
jgi:hypothetical protein